MSNPLASINLGALEDQRSQDMFYPDTVPGRTVHIDADFIAYQAAYQTPDDPKELIDMYEIVDSVIAKCKGQSGAEFYQLHLTPSGSDKGGRYAQAMIKEYQGNRKNKEKPEYTEHLRRWMGEERNGYLWMDREADDGMCMMQHRSIAQGDRELSVISSLDKDLMMVEGLHCDQNTGKITDVKGFGETKLVKKSSGKKLEGYGSSFFWAQMLTGDPADNISGLPIVHPKVCMKLKPTQAVIKAQAKLKVQPDHAPSLRAIDKVKPLKCGPATAALIMPLMKDDKSAFAVIKQLYQMAAEVTPFVNWRDGTAIRWQDAMVSDMQLLWMRRNGNDFDVLDWIKENAK